jgi:hypothetical protein
MIHRDDLAIASREEGSSQHDVLNIAAGRDRMRAWLPISWSRARGAGGRMMSAHVYLGESFWATLPRVWSDCWRAAASGPYCAEAWVMA